MIKSFLIKFCLVFSFFLSRKCIFSWGIIKFFQGLAKIFAKGADETTNVIKQSDEIFNINKRAIRINQSFGGNKKLRIGKIVYLINPVTK